VPPRPAAAAAFALALSAAAGAAAQPVPVAFSAIPGWAAEDHAAAFATFRHDCAAVARRTPARGSGPVDPKALAAACRAALGLPAGTGAAAARRFFETRFVPMRIGTPDSGFLTAYYEPEIEGARSPGGRFRVPLYRLPPDVVAVRGGAKAGLDPDLTHARKRPDGRLEAIPDRAAIDAGALAGRGLELVWLADPIDAFFVHIQGSARIRLSDGQVIRVGFAGRNGHPYTPIGRLLIERGEIAREEMTADRLARWLRDHPDEAPALMAANRSYIFFREIDGLDAERGPVGALGVPLTAGRSLAVDPKAHPFGTPVFVAADLPIGPAGAAQPFRRLMIADDTGAAIRGPARGDLFLGSGAAAQALAGPIRHPATFVVLAPRREAGDGG
jgi:membrane-bound lytic murein transglycosylase A